MDKTIIVAFENNEQRKEKKGLAQWDKGMTLKVYGLETTDKVQVHFSLNNICGDAKAVEATIENDAIVAKIPQFILEGPTGIRYQRTYNAYAFIYLYDEDSAETVKRIIFEVETRPKPVDYVHSEEELKEWTKLEQKIKDQSTQFENKQKKQDNVISEKISRPASAKVGQMLVVEAVDEDGKPTEWKVMAPPECKVKSVNGNKPDENGNISIETSGVKTVNGTAPDENGNIKIKVGVSSWNDLEDKPFGEEVIKTNVLEWDGDTTGREFGHGNDVKISDYTDFDMEDFIGSKVILNAIDSSQVPSGFEVPITFEVTSDMIQDLSSQGIDGFHLMFMGELPVVTVFKEDVSEADKGTYFIYDDYGNIFVESIETTKPIFPTTIIKKLDNKFIDAEWMAKEEVTKVPLNLTFDGEWETMQSLPYVVVDESDEGYSYQVRVADYTLTDEELKQSTLRMVQPTSSEPMTIPISEAWEEEGFVMQVGGNTMIQGLLVVRNASELPDEIKMVTENGIYFVYSTSGANGTGSKVYISELSSDTVTVETKTAPPLPEKFLPKEAIKAIAEEVILGGAW